MLRDFNAETLFDTIPNFHNTRKRLTDLFHSVIADECERVKQVKEELEYIVDNRNKAEILCNMLDAGEIPLRVTHNDTKCNNVLFDEVTFENLAVIDLDTVMPGLVAFDFGDSIRFIANTCKEDETDLSKVKLDLNKYRAFTKGFIETVGETLCQKEKETMVLGAVTMTVECGMRFLTDYIDGDKYFKTDYKEHNLDRARCQLALAKDMIMNLAKMQEIVDEHL
jgi:hypothetical protein